MDNKSQIISKISIFHQNIQHFCSRKLALEIVLDEIKSDIVILSEHKLQESDINNTTVSNYVIKSFFCRNIFRGGGVMILTKDSDCVKFENVKIPDISDLVTEKEFECCAVDGKIGNLSLIVLGLYRTPGPMYDDVFLSKLDILLPVLCKKYDSVILAGDVNIDVLKGSGAHDRLQNILIQHNFQYLVNFPTRVTIDCQTSIDNVFTNIDRSLVAVSGIVTELSDHDAQLVEIAYPKKKENQWISQLKRKFTKENNDLFVKKLATETWLDVYNAPVEHKYDIFYNIFLYYFNLCFPLIKSRVNTSNRDNWINYELRKEKDELIELSQTIRITKDNATKEVLKEKRKRYQLKVIEAKKEFINNKIMNSDNICKSTWKIINKEIKPKIECKNDIILAVDGQISSDPYKVSEVFNNHFINVVDKCVVPYLPNIINYNSNNPIVQNPLDKKFHIKPVSTAELDKVISSFKNKYSAGYDEVPMPIIKNAKYQLIKPIMHIINSSFVSGIFPEKLKISKIKTVFKKGSTTDPNNYRPLSLLPTLSKIFERVMYIRLVEFLEINGLFDDEQHGFRSSKSVITAGIEFVESILDAIDRGEHAVGIFMDLSKAFDSVCHSTLIGTLEHLGIAGVSLRWFESYLRDRKQYVELPHHCNGQLTFAKSEMKIIKYGVPQGSILGPVLFLCYIKGLPDTVSNLNSHMCLYADDSNLIISHKSLNEIEKISNENLISINNYFGNRKLLINTDKTSFMSFGTHKYKSDSQLMIKVHNTQIGKVNQIKFLGLTLDGSLSWDRHIQVIKKKISSGIYALKSISKFCNLETLKMVYYSHIHTHISFGVVLYGATSDINLQSILLLQKKAIRIMLNLQRQDSVKQIFSDLSIITIYGLYIFETVLAVRLANDSLPKLGTFHSYSTRNRDQLAAPTINLQFTRKKPLVAGIRFYNNLPIDILAIDNFKTFKWKLKQYLTSRSLYSFEEFFQQA